MRNIKTLGLVAAAALILVTSIGTSSASAAAFTAGGAGEALKHTLTDDHVITITGAEAECETINFTGTTTGASAASQSVSPSYKDCEAFGFANAEVHVNGCDYIFKSETILSQHATASITGCGSPTQGIQITVHVPFFATCVVDIPEQSIANAASYLPQNKSTYISITASKIMMDVTKSTGFCPLTTGTHSGANGGSYNAGSAFTTTNGFTYSF
jgi:hypothetical protein